ncbi:MAG: ATP-binding cassette domain-containing protein [Acidimicrobiales bacterium]
MNTGRRPSTLVLLGGLLALYLTLPVALLVVHLVTASNRGFGVPGLWDAALVSLMTATISATIIAVLGVPLAYVLARSRTRLAGAVGLVVQLPLALPPLVSGVLLLALVGPYTSIGRLFGGRLTDSLAGIVLAQTFVAAPFLVIAARSAFAAADPAHDEVGATLGLSPIARFFKISLPLASSAIAAGLLLSWLRAFGEFGATVILAYHPYSLPVFTYVQFSSSGLPDTLAPSFLAVAIAAAVGLGVTLVTGKLPFARRPLAVDVPALAPAERAARPLAFDIDRRLGTFHLAVAVCEPVSRLAVVGPSGAGKSTTLRALAGLLGPGTDTVEVGGTSVAGLAVDRRRTGYVPQQSGLLPHRTVWEQLMMSPRADSRAASFWAERTGLSGLRDRYPHELSGGQAKRVALARALSSAPDLLLLDEPFSSLDTPERRDLRNDLRRLLATAGIASVLVTHDPEEAALLADEVVIIDHGRVLQHGTRRAVFDRPDSMEVARLLGVRNVAAGRLVGPELLDAGGVVLAVDPSIAPIGVPILWSVAPEDITLGPGGAVEATVLDVADLGTSTEVTVRAGGLDLVARSPVTGTCPDPGMKCRLHLPRDAVRMWVPRPARGGYAIETAVPEPEEG